VLDRIAQCPIQPGLKSLKQHSSRGSATIKEGHLKTEKKYLAESKHLPAFYCKLCCTQYFFKKAPNDVDGKKKIIFKPYF